MITNQGASLIPNRQRLLRILGRAGPVVAVSAIALLMAGCAATSDPVEAPVLPTTPQTVWNDCGSDRPRICTMEYAPVCARLGAGGEKTYPSKCNACADIAVAAWRDAPCKER
jgi:hypothetical protein